MKTILIGLDAFTPSVFEKLIEENKLPHLAEFIDKGSYRHLKISNPAQSEVSWTSLATGLNPGGHGLFDFVHRNPTDYQIQISLLPTTKAITGNKFAQPHSARTFFDQVVEKGYPATSLWWPATFPAKLSSPTQTIPGLGTPDIFGQLGVGSLHSLDEDIDSSMYKSRVGRLVEIGPNSYSGVLRGPGKQIGNSIEHVVLDFTLRISKENEAIIVIGGEKINASIGKWSNIFNVNFKMGTFSAVRGITRVIVNTEPFLHLYFLPLQLHPLKSSWAYGTPKKMVQQAWRTSGPFLTLGWPQDTTALGEGIISDEQFLALCDDVLAEREKIFMQQLSAFDEGVLAIVFDTLDRVQHMFFNRDTQVLENWYMKIDRLFGRILHAVRAGNHEDARIIVVSDHGFAPYDYKVHVNRWLHENKWLKGSGAEEQKNLNSVNWSGTKAYALGLNSIYMNLQTREGQGIVAPEKLESERQNLRSDLIEMRGPDGRKVFDDVWVGSDAFHGNHIDNAPDLVLGYSAGYRSSAETGLGGYRKSVIETNKDRWSADHCINPASVPGVLMANIDFGELHHPSYYDFPELVLAEEFKASSSEPTEHLGDEDQEILEERLKGLGYL
jgi:predicted AlkP superfamily phosphohydrolase/phosphomutase